MAEQKDQPIHFEKSLEKLTKLVAAMEKGDCSLEKSLKHYEEGIHLIRQCQQALTAAEQKVNILSGQDTLTPYDNED